MNCKYNSHNKHGKLSQYNILACSLIGLTTVSALTLLSSTVSADTTNVNTISTTVPPSCSFTSASTSSYGATILNGQSTTITADPITVTCNDTAGYAVYAIGYSGDTYTGDYHTDMISTLNNSYNIKTNGTNGSSYWKMKLQDLSNAVIANSYNDYQVIPSSFTKIASYTSNTQAASFTPVYQIYIATTQAAGTYTGKVKYTLVHPSTMVAGTYNVAYNANGGTGTMTGSTGLYNFEEFTMPESTFTAPSGYIFAGWCTTNTAGSYACDGTSYAAGDKVTSLASAGSTATLYAYWAKIYMQDLTLANCPTDGMTVYDRRDGNDYTVKLINGQCWMTQNLRYLGDTGSAAKTMTIGNNNSNVANTSITLYSLNSSNAGSFNAYSSYCNSTNGYNYACVYDSGSTSIGVWYNFYAASAGTISGSSNSTAATSDICPAGWHLPSGPSTTANTDYNKLVGNTTSGYQDATSGLTAFSAVAGGSYYDGSLNTTEYGRWWSATDYNTTGRYNLGYNSGNGKFRGNISSSRYDGNFVRCVRSS